MITENEINSVDLSVTKADFYQIWNELLETADKLSERWSPASTNESDPGIVLLKVLTAIADKLNYKIDKNTLEAFMPSAAQEESMRKLCDMLGYSMKYYQSATTDVTISYTGEDMSEYYPNGIELPKYTNIKNTNDDINYFILSPVVIDSNTNKTKSVECMEGEVVLCADDTDNIVGLNQLDDNHRYYLPEAQIAENGIFIYNIDDTIESDLWTRVDNLNTQRVGATCFKFGYDSIKSMPYIQFPDDISNIIKDGLVIRYTRTNGVNGNISYNTLSTLEIPTDYSSEESGLIISENFAVKNPSAAMNGSNKETLNDAYNSYKKTIGTFDTLVTCRDYMNKIYQMVTSDANQTPLVSNVIVSDIRDDINNAITICTFDNYGIAYVDQSLVKELGVKGAAKNLEALQALTSSTVSQGDIYYTWAEDNYYCCQDATASGSTWALETSSKYQMTHFDLMLYPFSTITGSVSKDAYKNSFKYSNVNVGEIKEQLEDVKTISHNIRLPEAENIACIKNYLKLKARITTTAKVTAIEEKAILNNIYSAIFTNFNARKVDFGEAIMSDTIREVILNADNRIKNVDLDEPVLYTRLCLANGNEVDISKEVVGQGRFNNLTIRNIMSGRISLFDYIEDFLPAFSDTKCGNYKLIYGPGDKDAGTITGSYISKITSEFNIAASAIAAAEASAVELKQNEIIQFRAPNFKTTKTYPAYVNYFLKLNTSTTETKIDADTDYQLKSGEWLAINYTPSVTNEDGSTSTGTTVNKVCVAGDLIRPNFDMYDSNTYKTAGHTPTKRSGYDGMPDPYKGTITTTGGMFTFGVSEQVETRGPVEVVLNGSVTNLYFERNDEPTTAKAGDVINFIYDEDDQTAYTLKEGEYIYYTDESKIDLAYYGNGTKIIKQQNTPQIYKIKQDSTELASKIASEGLLAALPWQHFNLSGASKALTLKEYQYITLTEGDKACEVKKTDGQELSNNVTKAWQNVGSGKYKFVDDDTFSDLPSINISNVYWQIRSILNINTAPSVIQTLKTHWTGATAAGSGTGDRLILHYSYNNSGTESSAGEEYLVSTASDELSIEANYIKQSSTGEVDTHAYKYDSTGNIISYVNDFKVKVFTNATVKGKTGGTEVILPLNNYGNGSWTKLNFKDYLPTTGPSFALNVTLPVNSSSNPIACGLIMFYYNPNDSRAATNNAYLTINSAQSGQVLEICNADDGTDSESIFGSGTYWWNGLKDTTYNYYHLRKGLNIVAVPQTCTINVYSGDPVGSTENGTIVFSNLDLAKIDTAKGGTNRKFILNPYLDIRDITLQGTTQLGAAEYAFTYLAAFDPTYNFYYNAVIDNSLAINLNTSIDPDADDAELMTSPNTWYDYNNVNNKFVISEIDADYLLTGITLTPASRRK